MGKYSNARQCPAVDRQISAGECGSNRNSSYKCPQDCGHNPFSPANYDQYLDLEERTDKFIIGLSSSDEERFQRISRKAGSPDSEDYGGKVHALVTWEAIIKKVYKGASHLDEALKHEGALLKNDDQVALKSKATIRVALIEILTVIDSETSLAHDLLDPDRSRFQIKDRSLASRACRFQVFLGWIYDTPNFVRPGATLAIFPSITATEPQEVLQTMTKHLNEQESQTVSDFRYWAAENFIKLTNVVEATALARHHAKLQGFEFQRAHAQYSLNTSAIECLGCIEVQSDTGDDAPDEHEKKAGIFAARVWFESKDFSHGRQIGDHRPALGRVLLSDNKCVLEAMGNSGLDSLREKFEHAMQDKVTFQAERRDDFGEIVRQNQNPFDESLVPPQLLQNAEPLEIVASRVPIPDIGGTKEQIVENLTTAFEEDYLDINVPALDGLTPREAAEEPDVRPKLVQLMKERVCDTDEKNLRDGLNHSIDWMLEELELNEILFDAPPKRPTRE